MTTFQAKSCQNRVWKLWRCLWGWLPVLIASHLGPLQFVMISRQFSLVLHLIGVYIFPSESFLSYSISLCSSGVNFQHLHITVVSNPWLVVLFLVLELKTDATGRVP